MRRGLIVVVLVFIAILAIYYTTSRDAFTDLNIQRQNRTNPLAARQHPLTNPAAKIGTDDTSGSALRKLTGAAFSLPFMNILGHTNETPLTQITPRIDEEGSFLDEVNFCEKRAKISTDKKANPFKDPEFKAKCGMCMTTGTLANGKKFTKPTGILIYGDDKTIAREAQKDKGYRYPRLVPSLKSAKCQGEEASFSDDSRLPVVIIDDDPYDEWINNLKCQEEKKYNADKSCGLCVVNPVQWATVSTTTNISSITLTMVGQGIITIATPTGNVLQGQNLSLTSPLTANMGTKEDDTFSIHVAPTDDDPTVVLGAYVKGKNPDGTFYYLDLLEILTGDDGDVSKQITLGSDRFVIGDIADITAIAASPNPSGFYKIGSITLKGKIPFTFTKGQFADMLCPGGPYTTSEENQKILGISDPCLEEGQGPGMFSKQCIQTILRDAGCYQGGDWWNKGLAGLEKVGLPAKSTLEGIKSWMAGIVKKARRNPDMSMGCYGIDTTTPCDAYVGTDAVPSDECLAYMYSNKSENSGIGRSYITENFVGVPSAATDVGVEPKNYRSLNNLTDQYCQPRGEGNPEKNVNSLASLREVAKGGFEGKRGIEAVKMFLTKQYDGAVGTGRVSVDDVNTGPKAKWDSCFGVGLLPSDLIQSFVAEPGDLSGGGGKCSTKKVCSYEAMPTNTNIIAPQCTTGTIDALGLSRCFSSTLDGAKAKCDADPACDGITMHPGVGYEPRSMSRSVAGAVGAAAIQRGWGAMQGTSTALSGFKSWKKTCSDTTVCDGDKKCTYEKHDNKMLINLTQCPPGTPNYLPSTRQKVNAYEANGQVRCVQLSFEAAKELCDAQPECIGIHKGYFEGSPGWEPHGPKSWAGNPLESQVRAAWGGIQGLLPKSGWTSWMKKCDGDAPAPTPTPTPAAETVTPTCQNFINTIFINKYIQWLSTTPGQALNTNEKINKVCAAATARGIDLNNPGMVWAAATNAYGNVVPIYTAGNS